MYRIRFHGRGGQGMKTAAQVLGTAFFAAGFEVQDAPRYGAERRGAPIHVRWQRAHHPQAGVIARPGLVVVAGETWCGFLPRACCRPSPSDCAAVSSTESAAARISSPARC
jgi:pyruvate ferredoxin oxidoreductase gamma subunit